MIADIWSDLPVDKVIFDSENPRTQRYIDNLLTKRKFTKRFKSTVQAFYKNLKFNNFK